jgi:DNA modification methylase
MVDYSLLSNDQVAVFNSDVCTMLQRLPSESAQLILCDPPYYNIVADDWDHQWSSEVQYLDWCRTWTAECARVLRSGGMLAIWGTTKTDTFLRYKLDVLNTFKQLHYQSWIIWSYDWGGRTTKNFPRKHEDLLLYSKGSDFLFRDHDIRVPYKVKTNIRSTATNNPLGKVPTDVWEQNNHTMSNDYVGWHPTQKPIPILERLIKAYTEAGDLIVDPFFGSGNGLLAAIRQDRQYVGSDISKEYYNKTLDRVIDQPDQVFTWVHHTDGA